MQEFLDRHDVPTAACIPKQDHGLRKLESIIATILIFVQISSPLPLVDWDLMSISPAKAVLYSPDTKVPRTGELALRKAIPANANMKSIQVNDRNWFCLYFSNLYLPVYRPLCFFFVGFTGGYLIFTKDSTKKALWNHGG